MAKPRFRVPAGSSRALAPAGAPARAWAPSPYTAGDQLASDGLVNYLPSLGSADGDILRDRDMATARARDLVRNDGWAAGGVGKEVDSVIGANFRPLSKPDARALGLDDVWAKEFADAVDARWRSWADDPRMMADAARAQPLPQLFALAYRHYLIDGDALGVIGWNEERPTRTTLRIVDPDLLANPLGRQDGPDLRAGVEVDEDGAATGYHFRRGHPADPWAGGRALEWDFWPRETDWGRPMVLHFFDKHRDGQTRGVSRLSPIVETLRMEQRYSVVEIQAAVINAILGTFIESPFDNETVVDLLSDQDGAFGNYNAYRKEFHDARQISLGGARIPHLFPGEKIATVAAARPAAQFAEFESAVLRKIAAGMGITYEQLSADWSKTNYSSARAALIELWRGWNARRQSFAQRFCQPLRLAWLEEQFDVGGLPLPAGAPAFGENPAAYARAKWIGPGRGFVDPVKEAQAAAMRIALGISTLEDEAAELAGADYQDNLTQIAREIGEMPEGMLHPAQESFAKLIGGAPDNGEADRRPAA